jgi:hypothetical protein
MTIAHHATAIAPAGGQPIRTVARAYSATTVFIITPVTAEATINHLRNGDLTTTFQGDVQIGTPNADEWYAFNPLTTIGDSWEFRYLLTSGDAINVGGLVAGTWNRIDATRSIGQTITGSTPSIRTSTISLEYRPFSGGPTLFVVTGLTITASIT